MHKRVSALFILASAIVGNLEAQPVAQTASRSFTKNISCTPATVFVVNAEKATMMVTGWNNNYIQVRINYFARHPDLAIANRELGYMQFGIANEKDYVALQNIFKLPAAVDHIQSKLEIKMELMVPVRNKLQLTNKYGEINLVRLTGNIQVTISFGDLRFTDVGGNLVANAGYSDIRGNCINIASLNCTDEQSKISLDLDGGGHYSFFSKQGDLDLSIKKIGSLNIKSNRSDVTIRPQDLDGCRYKLISTDGTLYLPGKYTDRLIKKGNQTSFITTGSLSLPLLAVNASYNSVTIK
ncbi:hypothetical protein A4H97_04850 [Niastella yeongjuensis]|uniref:Adhesin domain-containing protein n=1 Tax=Niastella yeongjuensis TaxID=354355 RepID=A0A1V9ELV7_9BACT|nr:hypothetical protein [Niastella yeongjuensis]OQP46855.1 hypothetical protein A4H97_04850 [Niastella yeongjuensis]SEN57297.1 hypothetical protein SAMN05660816_00993 [Niastella yeongjuensis]